MLALLDSFNHDNRDQGRGMRFKIIGGNVVIVLLLGLGALVLAHRSLVREGSEAQREAFQMKRALFLRSWEAESRRLQLQVASQATQEAVVRAMRPLAEATRRRAAHDAAEAIVRWFEDPARGERGAPALVALLDDKGQVIARNKDINRWFQRDLTEDVPAVTAAMRKRLTQHDAWLLAAENKLLQVAVAPVLSESGAVAGALLVGYDMSAGFARLEAARLGATVSFVSSRGLYASSASTERSRALAAWLDGEGNKAREAALDGQRSERSAAQIGSQRMLLAVGGLPFATATKMAYLLAQSERAEAGLNPALVPWIAALVAMLVLMLAYGAYVGGRLVFQLERIEEGVLAAINGNLQGRLDTSDPYFGGICYRINQLLNLLGGVDEDASQLPEDAPPLRGPSELPPGPALPETDEALFALDEAAYLDALYASYCAAKAAAGENVASIARDVFQKRVLKNAEALASGGEGGVVRFRVISESGAVRLDPVRHAADA